MIKLLIILLLLVSPGYTFDLEEFKVKYGLPSNENIILKDEFVLSYNNNYKIPNWVAYVLTSENVSIKRTRQGSWSEEESVESMFRATNKDYYKTGYDRGHFLPSAAMVRSSEAMKSTFVFSNAAPQIPSFNRGIWKSLESNVRKWAIEHGEVVVFTGAYFSRGRKKTIGNKVGVPHYWFKVIYDPNSQEAIAFRMKNTEYASGEDYYNYRVSVDYIEKYAHLDFLAPLEDGLENEIESKIGNW